MFKRIPAASLPQIAQDGLHATVAVIVVLCVTVLAALGHVPADVTGAVFTGVVGYVAGRAGSIQRAEPSRTTSARPGVVTVTEGDGEGGGGG